MEGDEQRLPYWPITFFFSWPYYAMLSSKPHLVLLLLDRVVFNRKPAVGLCPSRAFFVTARSFLTASWVWLKTHSDRLSRGHLYISSHNTHHLRSTTWLLPLIYIRCVLIEEISAYPHVSEQGRMFLNIFYRII